MAETCLNATKRYEPVKQSFEQPSGASQSPTGLLLIDTTPFFDGFHGSRPTHQFETFDWLVPET